LEDKLIDFKKIITVAALTMVATSGFAQTPGDVNNDGLTDETDYLLISTALDNGNLDGLTLARPADLNGDIWLSTADKKLYEEFLAGRLAQPFFQNRLGDVTGDGLVDVQDTMEIANALNTTPVFCNRACVRLKEVAQRLEDKGNLNAAEKIRSTIEEKWGSETTSLSNIQLIFADIDGNGELTSNDLNLVQGLIDGVYSQRDFPSLNNGIRIDRR